MAYWVDIYRFRNHNEYEIKFLGKYGRKGEKRAPRTKPTREEVKRHNQWRREVYVRRLIELNFWPEDYWITLKYKRGYRPDLEQVTRDFDNFKSKMRRAYRKRGQEFKFISRLEIGRRGGIHIHILLNRIRGEPTDLLVKRKWKPDMGAGVYYTTLDEEGGYEQLAKYIVKLPDEEEKKHLEGMPPPERRQFVKFSTSKNLERPVPEHKEYRRRTLKSLILNGPVPEKGFYIDKKSVIMGVNPFTGYSYVRYTERRVRPVMNPEVYLE